MIHNPEVGGSSPPHATKKKTVIIDLVAVFLCDRTAYYMSHILPLLQALKQWAEEQAIIALPKSAIGKALGYLLKQYHKIETIFSNDRIELDNNLIENKILPLALGRKNYLFAGSHSGTQRIAMIYSFFASCSANDVNLYD